MAHLVDQHVLIDDVRIAHGVRGEGEPVVLIHGTPSSSYIWRNIVPALVEAGFHVHLYDLLGYGLSERPWSSDIDTSVTGQVPVLERLLEHWGLDDAHVVSHDIGGAVAQRLSVLSPERVRSLTLIDVCSFDSWPSKRTHQQMQEGLERLIKKADSEHREHFREWLLSTVNNKQGLTDTALETYLDYISGPIGQGSLFQHQVRHYDPKHTLEISGRLTELSALPVQIIWGEDDAWQVMDWAHKLHDAIPNSELHTLKNCGHFAMEDKPDEINRLLVEFLTDHRAE
ncbi:MAG: alpha/beta fold hydrolase [Hyphomicrobiaceae bacterium]